MIHDLLNTVDSHIRVVLLRHSLDSGGIDGDVVRELTETGIVEAEKTADFLKQFSFDQLYTSDHLRAKQTLGIVNLSLDMTLTVSRKLREVSPFYAMGDIELMKEKGQPVKDFFKALIKNSKENSLILAVTHGHLTRYILSLRSVRDESLEARSIEELCTQGLINKKGSIIEIQNSSMTVVDISKSGLVTPRLINFIEHL